MKLIFHRLAAKYIWGEKPLDKVKKIARLSGFWMGFFVNIFKLFDGIMRVNLGGRQAWVAQQFLDRIKIRAVIAHVRGKTMP